MKLLILTQKIDRNDTVLGFFHGWVVELAKKYEHITVICLGVGEYDLPSNVKVLSLGKETKASRFAYIFNFYKYIRSERKNYQAVFVHMNQEYVLLGGLLWRVWGKKIFLWRNHPQGTLLTRIAVFFSHRVFCTSEYSYTAKFKKTKIMPAGINTEVYKKNNYISRKQNSILFFGRVSPIKRPDVFVDACLKLYSNTNTSDNNFHASIVGNASKQDEGYFDELVKKSHDLVEKNTLSFEPSIPNNESPALYNKFEIYVNATPSGSFDKTILEAMSSEVIVCVSNKSLEKLIDERFIFAEGDSMNLASKLKGILALSQVEKNGIGKQFREIVENHHSLRSLVEKIVDETLT